MQTYSQFMVTLDNFRGRGETMGAQVNEYSKDAVRHYFETNNPAPVNKLLSIVRVLKLNMGIKQMERYMAATIPCQFDKKSGTFGKKQAKKFDAMKAQHEEFVTNNDWFTYELPEKDSNYKLNGDKLVEQVQKKIGKATEDGNTPTIAQLEALRIDMVNMINTEINTLSHLAIDEEITDLEAELITPETEAQAA